MTEHAYRLKGHLLGACNCDWGCPCSFEARPTKGFCEGSYIWHVEEGHFHGTPLNGSTFGGSFSSLVPRMKVTVRELSWSMTKCL